MQKSLQLFSCLVIKTFFFFTEFFCSVMNKKSCVLRRTFDLLKSGYGSSFLRATGSVLRIPFWHISDADPTSWVIPDPDCFSM
jgi:hypothetical protein